MFDAPYFPPARQTVYVRLSRSQILSARSTHLIHGASFRIRGVRSDGAASSRFAFVSHAQGKAKVLEVVLSDHRMI